MWIASYRERYRTRDSTASGSTAVGAITLDQLFFPMLVMGGGMGAAVALSCFERFRSVVRTDITPQPSARPRDVEKPQFIV